MEFKVGDIVTFGGIEGEVVSIDSTYYPLIVEFKDKSRCVFTLDGKYCTSHTEPLLKLKERPVKKNVRTFYEWIDRDGFVRHLIITEDFKDIKGENYEYEGKFLMWTGRSFDIEVDW